MVPPISPAVREGRGEGEEREGGRRPLRLAILEADTPVPGAAEKYGNYTGVFAALVEAAVAPSPLTDRIVITSHHVVDDYVPRTPYPALADIDAVLISGSKHNAHDSDPWITELVEFTRRCFEASIRVVGICFGHQIVARALGLRTGPNEKGWEVSVTEISLTDKGTELFPGLDKLKIHQMHRDIVFSDDTGTLPLGAQILATNDICSNQGMYAPGKLFTIQGHPEFNSGIVSEILELRHKMGILGNKIFISGMERVKNSHDGVLIAKAILQFCEESAIDT